MATMCASVEDILFDAATDVGSLRYRLHPIDVGWSIKAEDVTVKIHQTDQLRVSYEASNGDRRVISGPLLAVVSRLRKAGYVIDVVAEEG